MERQGSTPRDLEPFVGQGGRVSEGLDGKRSLALRMIGCLHDGPRVPCESLPAGAR